MAKQKYIEPIRTAVVVDTVDGSAAHTVEAYTSTVEAKQQDYHFEDDCVKKKKCILTSVVLPPTLSYCNEESENYENELRIENSVCIQFVSQ